MAVPQGNTPFITVAKEDEAITSTTVYTTRFSLDLEGYADGVIVIRNDSGTIGLNYRIYASAKTTDTLPADADDSWVNVLDSSSTPADYDHDTSKLLPLNTTFYESISNKFRWFRVSLQSVSGTVPTKIWFRARNVK